MTKTARFSAPPAERTLLDRGEFRPALVADLGRLAIETGRGDSVLIRQVGYFAVLVHLRWPEGPSRVWVASVVSGRLAWGEFKEHSTRQEAALDALKLVNSFQANGMAGD